MSVIMKQKRTRVLNAVAAGTSNQSGSVIDMAGFEGVIFEILFGTLTATQVTGAKVQVGNASDLSDAVDLIGVTVGPMADDDDNQILVVEVARFPIGAYRYCRVVVTRGTANAVIDGAIAIQYGARKLPESDDSTTVSESKVAVAPEPTNSALTVTTTTPAGTTTKFVTTHRNSS